MLKIEIPLKCSFTKISTAFDKPSAILLNFLLLLLKYMVFFFCKADSMIEVSLPASHCVSVRHNISLSNKHVISMSEYLIRLL